jgi:hypothetical protein
MADIDALRTSTATGPVSLRSLIGRDFTASTGAVSE